MFLSFSLGLLLIWKRKKWHKTVSEKKSQANVVTARLKKERKTIEFWVWEKWKWSAAKWIHLLATIYISQSHPWRTSVIFSLKSEQYHAYGVRLPNISKAMIKESVKNKKKMFTKIFYGTVVIITIFISVRCQENFHFDTFGHCLKQSDKPSIVKCAGQQALETLQQFNSVENFTLAKGLIISRDDSVMGRNNPVNFMDNDPSDIRWGDCGSEKFWYIFVKKK